MKHKRLGNSSIQRCLKHKNTEKNLNITQSISKGNPMCPQTFSADVIGSMVKNKRVAREPVFPQSQA